MLRARGFTLLEIMISICILLVILGLAVPSLSGVLADKRLRRSMNEFNNLVRQAQERSVGEHRAYLIAWDENEVVLRPEAFAKGEEIKPTAKLALAKGESLVLSLPAALAEDLAAEWIFWPSGTCEPAIVKFSGANGSWAANYSPLTARSEPIAYAPR
jgi:prepilin-type N-terminal cleavage/methylation domain-containing protein